MDNIRFNHNPADGYNVPHPNFYSVSLNTHMTRPQYGMQYPLNQNHEQNPYSINNYPEKRHNEGNHNYQNRNMSAFDQRHNISGRLNETNKFTRQYMGRPTLQQNIESQNQIEPYNQEMRAIKQEELVKTMKAKFADIKEQTIGILNKKDCTKNIDVTKTPNKRTLSVENSPSETSDNKVGEPAIKKRTYNRKIKDNISALETEKKLNIPRGSINPM